MNKQQQPTTDNTQLIQKLRSEYEELHKKCCKLYAFRHSLDVDQKMNFDMEALVLMQRQLEMMEAYRYNLYLRIRHLARLSIEIKTEHDPNFDEVDPEQKAQALHHCGQDECNRSGLITLKEMVNDYVERCDEKGRLKIDLHHCGQDAVNFEQLSDNLTDTYKDYCRGVFEQFLSREITWAKFVEKEALPFCHENVNEFVNAIKEGRSDCGQDASCPVGGGSAAVNQENGDSLKDLLGMEVISYGGKAMKCEGCSWDCDNCVKVELVGGFYLCLATQPGSIITE